jgi:hypothetical protein
MKILSFIVLIIAFYKADAQQTNNVALTISIKNIENKTYIVAILQNYSGSKLRYMPMNYNTNWSIMVQNPTNSKWEVLNPFITKAEIPSKHDYYRLVKQDTLDLQIDIENLFEEQNILLPSTQYVLCKVVYKEKLKKFQRRKKFLQIVESNVIKLPIAVAGN